MREKSPRTLRSDLQGLASPAAAKEKGKKSAPILQCELTQLPSSARKLRPPHQLFSPHADHEGHKREWRRRGREKEVERWAEGSGRDSAPATKVARKDAPSVCPSGLSGQEKIPLRVLPAPWQGGGRAERPERPALNREALGGAEARLLNKKIQIR